MRHGRHGDAVELAEAHRAVGEIVVLLELQPVAILPLRAQARGVRVAGIGVLEIADAARAEAGVAFGAGAVAQIVEEYPLVGVIGMQLQGRIRLIADIGPDRDVVVALDARFQSPAGAVAGMAG